jgi:hypothetical protein
MMSPFVEPAPKAAARRRYMRYDVWLRSERGICKREEVKMRGNLILIWPRLFDARTCSNKWPTNLIFTPGQNACNQVADDT